MVIIKTSSPTARISDSSGRRKGGSGTYVTQVIGGKTYTSYLSSGSSIKYSQYPYKMTAVGSSGIKLAQDKAEQKASVQTAYPTASFSSRNYAIRTSSFQVSPGFYGKIMQMEEDSRAGKSIFESSPVNRSLRDDAGTQYSISARIERGKPNQVSLETSPINPIKTNYSGFQQAKAEYSAILGGFFSFAEKTNIPVRFVGFDKKQGNIFGQSAFPVTYYSPKFERVTDAMRKENRETFTNNKLVSWTGKVGQRISNFYSPVFQKAVTGTFSSLFVLEKIKYSGLEKKEGNIAGLSAFPVTYYSPKFERVKDEEVINRSKKAYAFIDKIATWNVERSEATQDFFNRKAGQLNVYYEPFGRTLVGYEKPERNQGFKFSKGVLYTPSGVMVGYERNKVGIQAEYVSSPRESLYVNIPFNNKKDDFKLPFSIPATKTKQYSSTGFLAFPARLATEVPVGVFTLGAETAVTYDALKFDATRNEARTQEGVYSTLTLPIASVKAMNPKYNKDYLFALTSVVSAPSFYKLIKKSPRIIGIAFADEEVSISSLARPQVLEGNQRFPYTKGQTPTGLLQEFKTSRFQQWVKNTASILKGRETTVRGYIRYRWAGVGDYEIISNYLKPDYKQRFYLEASTPGYVSPYKAKRYKNEFTGGYSASPVPIVLKSGVGRGTSATAGIYIAPDVSVYFLKINEPSVYKLGLFTRENRPTIQYLATEGVQKIPQTIIKDVISKTGIRFDGDFFYATTKKQRRIGIKILSRYFESPEFAGSGKAMISAEYYFRKREAEALVSYSSRLKLYNKDWTLPQKLFGFRQYTRYKGEIVPIRIVEVLPSEEFLKKQGVKGKVSNSKMNVFDKLEERRTRNILKSSERIGQETIGLADTLGGSLSSSYKPSNNYYNPFPVSSRLSPNVSRIGLPPSYKINPSESRVSPNVSRIGLPPSSYKRGLSRYTLIPEVSIPPPSSYKPGRESAPLIVPTYKSRKTKSREGNRIKSDFVFTIPFKTKYFASIEATAFGIKGKAETRLGSGLSLRPISMGG